MKVQFRWRLFLEEIYAELVHCLISKPPQELPSDTAVKPTAACHEVSVSSNVTSAAVVEGQCFSLIHILQIQSYFSQELHRLI